jgi:hypothetical protein
MARQIKATPLLCPAASRSFNERLRKSALQNKGIVPTPKVNSILKRIIADAKQKK